MLRVLLIIFILANPSIVLAKGANEGKTVVLSVPTMSCPVCPITVKKALKKVSGVKKVTISLDDKQAVVEYDDTITTPAELSKATTNSGFPSTIAESDS